MSRESKNITKITYKMVIRTNKIILLTSTIQALIKMTKYHHKLNN